MADLRVLQCAVAFMVLQQSAQVLADPPRDTVERKGIIVKLLTEAETKDFQDTVTVEGVLYKKSGSQRQLDIEGGDFLAFLQRYVQTTDPKKTFDYMVITQMGGLNVGKFVTAGRLITLKQDKDVEDAIIKMTDPLGLEFVLVGKKCAFIKKDETVIWNTYDCGNDNYVLYV